MANSIHSWTNRLSYLAGFYALQYRISYKIYSEPLKHTSSSGLIDGLWIFIWISVNAMWREIFNQSHPLKRRFFSRSHFSIFLFGKLFTLFGDILVRLNPFRRTFQFTWQFLKHSHFNTRIFKIGFRSAIEKKNVVIIWNAVKDYHKIKKPSYFKIVKAKSDKNHGSQSTLSFLV